MDLRSQGRPSARFVQLATNWPVMLATAAATGGAAWLTFLISGALVFSGRPQPTPLALYPGLALVALLVPMLVALIFRALARGRRVVVVTQALALPANLLFWIAFLSEFSL